MKTKHKHQFIHIEVYSRVPPKNTKQWSASDVLKEAARDVAHSGHVHTPYKPEIIYGGKLEEIEEYLSSLDKIKTSSGRKLRKDAKVLMAGVVSYPIPTALLTKEDGMRLHSWEVATRNFLYRKFGTRLASIVRHTDETYPHLHFYVLSKFEDGELMDDVHPGMKKRKECQGGKHAKQTAMVQGLVEFQDEYHQAVSQYFGHSRISKSPKARQKYAFHQRSKVLSSLVMSLKKQVKDLTDLSGIIEPERYNQRGGNPNEKYRYK